VWRMLPPASCLLPPAAGTQLATALSAIPCLASHRALRYAALRCLQGLVFFLGREVPREQLLFVIRAFGGEAAWDGEGSPYTEAHEAITHQVGGWVGRRVAWGWPERPGRRCKGGKRGQEGMCSLAGLGGGS
jgi:hypothetical protein